MLAVLYFFVPAYVANMSPVVVRNRFPSLAAPIDGGLSWRGRRLLGDHKTWRGLLVGIVVGRTHAGDASTQGRTGGRC